MYIDVFSKKIFQRKTLIKLPFDSDIAEFQSLGNLITSRVKSTLARMKSGV